MSTSGWHSSHFPWAREDAVTINDPQMENKTKVEKVYKYHTANNITYVQKHWALMNVILDSLDDDDDG